MDEYADILGNASVPLKRRQDSSYSWTKLTATVLLAALSYVVYTYVKSEYLKWREKSYKLSLRRRYGIPDTDRRPFNIAHADVLKARQRQGLMKQAEETARMQRFAHEIEIASHRSEPHVDAQATRSGSIRFPGAYGSSATPIPSYINPASYPTNLRGSSISLHPTDYSTPSRRAGLGLLNNTLSQPEDDALVTEQHIPSSGSPLRRGEKRMAEDENHDKPSWSEKRARKETDSTLDDEPSQDEMDVDEDVQPLLAFRSRGQKRDRKEADYVLDEILSDEDEQEKENRRKRRNKRKSDAVLAVRGTKRDRGSELEEDEVDAETENATKKKRKGRKSKSATEVDEDGLPKYIPMDESSIKSKGRIAGEIWESNGTRYKMGPDGQRLVEALVKKSRPRFSMPQDSIHPDREANFDVFVETWLTDAEYNEAKANKILAWQQPPPVTVKEEPKEAIPPPVTKISPVKGKHLLYNSVGPSTNAPPMENPFKEPSKGILRERRDSTDSRRINLPRGLSDSINGRPRQYRQYSTWEKQELEAQAMMKLREASGQKKEEEERLAKEKVDAATKPSIPAISISQPASSAAPAKPPAFPAFTASATASATASKPDDKSISQPDTKASFAFPVPQSSTPSSTSAVVSPPAAEKKGPTFTALAPTSVSTAPKPVEKPTLGGLGMPPAAPAPAIPQAGSAAQPSSTSSAPTPFFSKASNQPPPSHSQTQAAAKAETGNNNNSEATSQPKFDFSFGGGKSPAPAPQPVKQPAVPTSGGPPLLGRLGGFQTNSSASKSEPPKSDGANPGAQKFSFGGFAAAAPEKPTSSFVAPALGTFGKPAENKEQNSVAAPATSPAIAQPKFSFGVTVADSNKSSSAFGGGSSSSGSTAKPTTFAFGAPSTTSALGQTSAFGKGPEVSKDSLSAAGTGTSSVFGTGSAKPSGESATSNPFLTSGSTNSAPKPVFGQTSTFGSGFSAASKTESSSTDTAPKPMFGGFGNSPAAPPASTTAVPKSVFGQTSTANTSDTAPKSVFGQSSTFGGNLSTSTTDPSAKTAFGQTSGFGSGSTATGVNPLASGSTFGSGFTTPAKATPAFGGSSAFQPPVAGSSTPNGEPPKPTFGFGGSSFGASAGSSTPASDPPKAFGSFGSTGAFGSTTGNATTAETPKPAFSFGGGTGGAFGNPSGTSTPASEPSKNVFGGASSTSNNNIFSNANASSNPPFGTSSTTSAFGANPTFTFGSKS